MKKTIKIILIILFTISFVPNVYASNNISIDNITLIEKSDEVLELSKPKINGINISFDLGFLDIGDSVKYKVIISNNSSKDYYIDKETKFSSSNYISYIYEYSDNNNKLKANSKLTMYITIKYNKQVPVEKLASGMYIEENSMSIDLSDVILTNPSTYSNILIFLLIISILIVMSIIKIRKKQKIGINLLLIGLLLIPVTVHALEKLTLKVETKITIEEQRNMIETRYENNNTYPERDFWQYHYNIKTITFETEIRELSNYAYKFDVSEAKNNGIIAYLIENAEDSSCYDLYIMSNGYIYANPNSKEVFASFTNLTEINNIENYKTNYVTTMSGMFYAVLTIEYLDLRSFNTSNVIDMSNMFYSRIGTSGHGLLKKIDLSTWDTSKVENMTFMFGYCSELTDLDVSNWNTSSLKEVSFMFYCCESLAYINVSNWDTSNIINMYALFSNCYKLNSLDVSNWNTSKVTNMGAMFSSNHLLKELNVNSFDTSNVTTMENMFDSCSSLTEIDISSFDTSNVTKMSKMFLYDYNLESIYVGNNWNIDNVTSSGSMFDSCTKLPNFNPNIVDKTNANTSETGYLTLKS